MEAAPDKLAANRNKKKRDNVEKKGHRKNAKKNLKIGSLRVANLREPRGPDWRAEKLAEAMGVKHAEKGEG